jgi:hypothetical protein
MAEEGWPCATEPCGGAPRHTRPRRQHRVGVAVQPRCAGRRGNRGEANGVAGLASNGFKGSCHPHRPSATITTRQRGKRQIGAWPHSNHGRMGSGGLVA